MKIGLICSSMPPSPMLDIGVLIVASMPRGSVLDLFYRDLGRRGEPHVAQAGTPSGSQAESG